MPRKPAANAEIRKARRKEILRAAARVFAERGLREAKVSDIARAAGLSHGLIYHYFDSKDALAEAIFEEKLGQMSEVMASGFTEGPVLDRLARGCELFIAQTNAEPELALFVTQAIVNRALPDRLRKRMTRNAKLAFEQLIAMIEEGQRTGEIANDAPADSLATAVAALIRGLSLFHEVKVGPTPSAPPGDVIARLLRPRSSPPAALSQKKRSSTAPTPLAAAQKARTAGRRRRTTE
jgi:AcrR family transcriptional regulator